jgi:hypothetical protein
MLVRRKKIKGRGREMRTFWAQSIVTFGLLLFIGCQFTSRPLVRNGTQIESASIPIVEFEGLVIPKNWAIEENHGLENEVHLKITKKLGYAGIPADPISLDDVVSSMGVVQKKEGSDLKLRDFGGFMTSSGGTSISVSIVVPKTINLKTEEFEQLRESDIPKMAGWSQIDSNVVSKEQE